MNRIIKNLIAVTALVSAAALSIGSAGSSSDPLISRSFLEGEYRSTLVSELDKHITTGFNGVYDTIFTGRPLIPEDEGFTHSANFGAVKLYPDQTVTFSQGTSFIVKSGTVQAAVSSGVMLNLSNAEGVTGTFTPMAQTRYMLAEDSSATLQVGSEEIVTLLVDGHYKHHGEGRGHHRVFQDVELDSWYCPAVDYAYTNSLFKGTSDTEFSPAASMTRGMFVTVLHRLYGSPATDGVSAFSDVSDPSAYYYTPVMWASSHGIVLGYDDGTFCPDTLVSREQMATIMYRYAEACNYDTHFDTSKANSFPDCARVSDYAYNAMCWAVHNSIINGSDGKLLPGDSAQRCHVAQIIMNFTGKY